MHQWFFYEKARGAREVIRDTVNQLFSRIVGGRQIEPFVIAACIGIFYGLIQTVGHIAFLSGVGLQSLPAAYLVQALGGYLTHRRLGAASDEPIRVKRIMVFLMVITGLVSGWSLFAVESKGHAFFFGWFLFIAMTPLMNLFNRWGRPLIRRCPGFDDERTRDQLRATESFFAGAACLMILFHPAYAARLYPLLFIAVGAVALVAILANRLPALRTPGSDAPITRERENGSPDTATGGYTSLLFIFSGCMTMAAYALDFLFLGALIANTNDVAGLTVYLALFFGLSRLAEPLLVRAAKGPILRIFGVSAGIVIRPALVFLCLATAELFGATMGDHFELFLALALARSIDLVLCRGLFGDSFTSLLLPLPVTLASRIRNRVHGLLPLIALIVIGVALTVSLRLEIERHLVALPVLLLLLTSVVLAVLLRRRFRRLVRHALESGEDEEILASPMRILQKELASASPGELVFALNVLEQIDPALLEAFLSELLNASDPLVRSAALDRIGKLQLIHFHERVARLSVSEPDETVQSKASTVLANLNALDRGMPDVAAALQLAGSDHARDRLKALEMIGQIPVQEARSILLNLLWDNDLAVKRRAILAAGQSGIREFWPLLIDHLSSGLTCKAAASALVMAGEPLLISDSLLMALRTRPAIRLRLLEVHSRIGGETATNRLFSMINDPDSRVRRKALFALTYQGFRADRAQEPLIKGQIEQMVDHLTWNMATARDLVGLNTNGALVRALEWEKEQNLTLLFMLLALICDRQPVSLMRRAITEGPGSRGLGLEVAREVLPDELKSWLTPLFVDSRRTLTLLSDLSPRPVMSASHRLEDVFRRGPEEVTPWTRTLAIEAWSALAPGEAPDGLVALLYSPHLLEAESAARALRGIDQDRYCQVLGRLPHERSAYLAELLPPRGGQRFLLQVEKAPFLSRSQLFGGIAEPVLASMVVDLEEIHLADETVLFRIGDKGNELFVVVEGVIRVHNDAKIFARMQHGDMFGEIAVVETGTRTLHATAEGETRLLCLKREQMLDFLTDSFEVIAPVTRVIAQRRARG